MRGERGRQRERIHVYKTHILQAQARQCEPAFVLGERGGATMAWAICCTLLEAVITCVEMLASHACAKQKQGKIWQLNVSAPVICLVCSEALVQYGLAIPHHLHVPTNLVGRLTLLPATLHVSSYFCQVMDEGKIRLLCYLTPQLQLSICLHDATLVAVFIGYCCCERDFCEVGAFCTTSNPRCNLCLLYSSESTTKGHDLLWSSLTIIIISRTAANVKSIFCCNDLHLLLSHIP